jgi:hypothetical protein
MVAILPDNSKMKEPLLPENMKPGAFYAHEMLLISSLPVTALKIPN